MISLSKNASVTHFLLFLRYQLALLFACIFLIYNIAQGQTSTAQIEVRVTDTQNARISGATTTIESSVLLAPQIAISDETGTSRFLSLPPGVYSISISIEGFETQQYTEIEIKAGEIRIISTTLNLARLTHQVDVIGVAPMLGVGVNPNHVPALVSVIRSDDLEARSSLSLTDTLHKRLGSITIEGTTTNLFQPNLRFRGFTASPLLGLPQGIAVYQNGTRINEPFGDTVQFDLIPQFAIEQLQLSAGSEPTYGMNALGGALVLNLKNGFKNSGFRSELSGGSFNRFSGTAEFGKSYDSFAFYIGANRFNERGWRVASESEATQAVVDLGYRNKVFETGLSFTHVNSKLNGNGPVPIELLEINREAVFTFPDTTENKLSFLQGRFSLVSSQLWSMQITSYYRKLNRHTLNGDEANFEVCDNDELPSKAPNTTLCIDPNEDENQEDFKTEGPKAKPIIDLETGQFITTSNALGTGAFNRTATSTLGFGTSLQATTQMDIAERSNMLTLGISLDLADVVFTSNSEVGTLTPKRTVLGSGLLAGIFQEAPDDQFNTGLDTKNKLFGLYFTDTFSLSEQIHLTISGRYNRANINMTDRLGTALTGEHTFTRFNSGLGAVYELLNSVSLFGRYSESNRAPTAAELSCADPTEPCRLPNAFVHDPDLKQVVSRSVEVGARGRKDLSYLGNTTWSISAYKTLIQDDILFVASPVLIGMGFFKNAGKTQRLGIDTEINGSINRLNWFTSYSLINATFESPLMLPSNQNVNNAANKDGSISVVQGDMIPGIPRHSLKGGINYKPTIAWNISIETILASSRIFTGDEGNDQKKLDGYSLMNLHSSHSLNDNFTLFIRINNLLNTKYETFGLLAEVEIDIQEVPNVNKPQFLSPGFPRSILTGLKINF